MKKLLGLLLISLLLIGVADATDKQTEKETIAQLRIDLRDLEAEYDARLSSNQAANHLLPMINNLRLDLGMPLREEINPLDQGGESCATATIISSIPYTDTGSLDDDNDCQGPGYGPYLDVFYKLTAPYSGNYTFDMCGTAAYLSMEMRVYLTACCDFFIYEHSSGGCPDNQPTITWYLDEGDVVYIECGKYSAFPGYYPYTFHVTGPDAGRCCYGSSSQYCTVNSLVDCDAINGTWNTNLTCSTPCPGETGRCCYGDPGDPQCANNTLSQCNGLGGTWNNDLGCNSSPCPGTLGRCCYGDPGDPQCTDNTSDACAQLGGEWDIEKRCDTHPCAGPCPYPNLDIEPDNNDCGEARPEIACWDTLCGEHSTSWDTDWYKLVVPAGGYPSLIIDVYGNDTPGVWPYGEGLDPIVFLCDETCDSWNALYYNDDNYGPPGPVYFDSRITTEALDAGTYYIGVDGYESGPYVLTVTCDFEPGRCCYGPPFDYGCEIMPLSDCDALGGVFEFNADCSEPCGPYPGDCQCGLADYSHCNGTGGTIHINTVNDFVINVPEEYHITDLNVCWTLDHNYLESLGISLISPSGTEVLLSDQNGSLWDDMICTTMDDEGDSLVADGHATFTGSYIPDEPLSTFNGENAMGDWILRIDEIYNRYNGELVYVCLTFEYDEILPVELSSFDAVPGDGKVTLNWSTASETNNDHFNILRNNTPIARIQATNSATGCSYNWTETNLSNGREYTYSLVSVDVSGASAELGTVSATPTFNAATVTEYALHQNYPNPFNPSTTIIFDMVESGHASITVYNSLGQTMATLVNAEMPAGRHTVDFKADALPSGLYFYRMEAGDFTAVKKMILMK